MICVVFAVAAVETFIYELGEEAFRLGEWKPDVDQNIVGLGELIRDLEEAKYQLVLKALWVERYLTGKRPDRGSALFQDFDLLVRLRNTIIHLKDTEEHLFYDDGSVQTKGTPKVVSQLASRKLIPSPYQPSWIVAVSTIKIAAWSCQTAAQMMMAIVHMLPHSDFRDKIAMLCDPLRKAPWIAKLLA